MTGPVLIADDNIPLVRNLALGLDRRGIRTATAVNGHEALAALENDEISVVCIDISLPDCDGLQLLAQIRQSHPDLPAIVMSGQDSVANRARANDLNARAFLAKPFPLETLREAVIDALPKRYTGLRGGGSAAQAISDHPGMTPIVARFTGSEAARRRPVSVMMYSHDSIGLGHMRRNSNIAARLVEQLPGASVLMMVGCPAGVLFDLPDGVDCIKLPSILKVDRDVWRPRSLNISAEKIKALRSSLILRTAQILRPTMVLIDHVPTGVWGELLPTLQMLRASENPPKIILGLRDILDTPDLLRESWKRARHYVALERYYDELLIYGDRAVFDTATQYGLADNPSRPAHYCGYLCNEAPVLDRDAVRERFAVSQSRLVVVTAGGGSDAYPMMAATMAAMNLLGPTRCPEAIFVTGPLMAKDKRRALSEAAAGLPIQLRGCVADMPSLLNAADLVVTMAGYNTLMETLRLGQPAIVIPREGPSAEQSIRANLLDRLGLVRALTIAEATPERLSRILLDTASDPKCRGARLDFGGLDVAVQHLISGLDSEAAFGQSNGGLAGHVVREN